MRERYFFEFPLQKYPGLPTVLRQYIHTTEQLGIVLDSNQYPSDRYSRYQWLAGWRPLQQFDTLDELDSFQREKGDWLLGHLNYNLKNTLERLKSTREDIFDFPLSFFFVPDTVVYCRDNTVRVESYSIHSEKDFRKIVYGSNLVRSDSLTAKLELQAKTNRYDYVKTVHQLKEELQFGNIYEINYCIEFWAQQKINPFRVFEELNHLSQAPFSAFYKYEHNYLLCSSPERYLQRTGDRIISQPIKGTAKRSTDPSKDRQLAENLTNDKKERSENVMIVDLVRNDLSRTAQKNSVEVDELFGVYTFKNVHQLISTISSRLKDKLGFSDLIKTTFPMGSMTGAPKIKAMELIDEYENFNRSLYAGSVGYIDPKGDFDFNVVIRSLLYNHQLPYLSARVGSAITIHADAGKEYEECLLKAKSLFRCLR